MSQLELEPKKVQPGAESRKFPAVLIQSYGWLKYKVDAHLRLLWNLNWQPLHSEGLVKRSNIVPHTKVLDEDIR